MAEKDVFVKVILDPPGSIPPFHLESDDVPIDKENVIYFSNCGKLKGFSVNYVLDAKANPGFAFPTEAKNGKDYLDQALWVTDSGPCPTKACKWGVFEAKGVDNNGMTLVVKNKNEVVQKFAYTLRVTNGSTWLDLDPVGSNQNGGFSFYESMSTGVVTGGIVGLGAAAFASNTLEPTSALVFALGGALVGLVLSFVLDRI